jgi:hypothetical protein
MITVHLTILVLPSKVLNGGSHTLTLAERQERVIKQLTSLFGKDAEKLSSL